MSLPPPLPVPGVVHADTLRAESELGALATLYAVLAGLQGLMLLVGGFLACGVHREVQLNVVGQSPDQAQAGVVAIVPLSALLAFGLVSLVLEVPTARALRQRRRLCLRNLTAAVTCLGFPLGTAMGMWTPPVPQRPASVALFRTSGR
ncbi:hypothetical protein [Xanthomonas theicola]|uniref:Uncharacterized protein n=1 Tax=Xanthomonas theicola TaxID=56464 RepID=A0A2S6ZKE5_9XANT|nr:hypothetical protein [Xanthomonas theicola]PPT92715.1 hypothetical protein XthCFBP4691_02595 [Xanthomonas theicola]QNH24366.1 hypothetical protein G4Q83_05795 [Xanthomonas theicola]